MKAKKKPAFKFWEVDISMNVTLDLHGIKARTASEAKAKAWKRFASRPPKKWFDVTAEKEWN